MAEVEALLSSIEATGPMLKQLLTAFHELEKHRASAANYKLHWKELEEHFSAMETSLRKKFAELEKKEKEFEAKAAQIQESLKQREALVAGKEQAYLDRVQELKDSAVAEILEACGKQEKTEPPTPKNAVNAEGKVKIHRKGEPNLPVSKENLPGNAGGPKPAESKASEVKPRTDLMQSCKHMDAKGLLNFISDNRKALAAIRLEIPVALNSATDPAQLVLECLKGFYPTGQTQGAKVDSALSGTRRSCLLLLESLASISKGNSPGTYEPVITPDHKQQAKAVADEWKPKLADGDADVANGNSLEVHAFLQLVATFDISSEFDGDELSKLVLAIVRRKLAYDLCNALGLASKIPGIIETLCDTGKQIEAVRLIHAFKLTDDFPPVPLLKTHLKDLRRASQGKGTNAPGSQQDGNAKELGALRTIIKCVEEYKLEAEYPLDPLHKRALQLEKAKSDKKRLGEAAKPQPKRSRANGATGHAPWLRGQSASRLSDVLPDRSVYRNSSLDGRYMYQQSQAALEYQIPAATYAMSSYSIPSQAQAPYDLQPSLTRSYAYQDIVAAVSPTGSYSTAPTTYSSIYRGSGLQSTQLPPTYL